MAVSKRSNVVSVCRSSEAKVAEVDSERSGRDQEAKVGEEARSGARTVLGRLTVGFSDRPVFVRNEF